MFGFISGQAASVSAPRRPTVAVEKLTETRPSGGGARLALGLALVSIGQRVAGEMPAGRATQPDGDCA
jgi:hypothetical protein